MVLKWRDPDRKKALCRLIWICACVLVAKEGSVGATTAYNSNTLPSTFFIRYSAWSGSCPTSGSRSTSGSCSGSGCCDRISIPKRPSRTRDHRQRHRGQCSRISERNGLHLHRRPGDVIPGETMPSFAPADAGTISKETFRNEGNAISSMAPSLRGIPGRRAGSAVAAVSSSTGANEKSPPVGENAKNDSETRKPGSRPSTGVEKQDEAAVKYANDGDWKKALQLIKTIRDSNLKPSVTAYVATIEACRRELLFDYASALLRDMFRVCMPEDLFAEFAASHPNDSGVTQTERVFALLLMMREDGVSPIQETYRAIMGMCSKEHLWHLSLLLLEHLRQSGLVPGKFVWDEICTVLLKAGHSEMATMMFETALEENTSGEETLGISNGLLDLHHHTTSTALAAVRIALLDMVRKPTSREYHDPARPLSVVTGMGNNSKDGEAVIKPKVIELLTSMGLEPKLMRNNEGCIVLQSDALQDYAKRLTLGARQPKTFQGEGEKS